MPRRGDVTHHLAMSTAAQALHLEDVAEAPSTPCVTSVVLLTTEGRMARAGIHERERLGHRRAIGRVARDVGADAGLAVRRSVEVHAELRRVLGSEFGAR